MVRLDPHKSQTHQKRKDEIIVMNENEICKRVFNKVAISNIGGIYRLSDAKRIDYQDRNGYMLVRVRVGGRYIATGAHRLIWRLLVGPIPEKYTINHKNGNRTDNRLENLELATQKENVRHAIDVLHTFKPPDQKGTKNTHAKLTWEKVYEIRASAANGRTQSSLAREYNVRSCTICKIINYKNWRFE